MNLFYHQNINETVFDLNPEEAQHALKVKRLRAGEIILITDGKGHLGKYQIMQTQGQKCTVQLLEKIKHQFERACKIHLAIAPTKNMARMEWMLEKCTEIGLDTLTFLQCQHSERIKLKTDRLEKIAIAALKQSKQAYLPALMGLENFEDFVKKKAENTQKMMAYVPEMGSTHLFHQLQAAQNLLVLVGPEGDFSPQEVSLALEQGFQLVSLGNTVLRTETAGLVACQTFHLKNL